MNRYGLWVIRILAALLFLAPLKFGTPVIIQSVLIIPQELFEWVFYSWPNQLAVILAVGTLLWMILDPKRVAARLDSLFWLPLLWLATQLAALPASVNLQVSVDTVTQFAVYTLVFYAGAWYVRDGAAFSRLGGALAIATLLVCLVAFQQYFGGLEETRAYAELYLDAATAPPDLLLRLRSTRVFGTLVYPNALAGLIIVAFGPALAWIWGRSRNWHALMRWVALGFMAAMMVGCLVLTGSRGGFAAFVAGLVAAVLWSARRGWRRAALAAAVVVGIFGALYVAAHQRGLFRAGISSLEARRDYWWGALAIIRDHPWIGTGPGTFGSVYPKYKTAQTEEAQTAHNNFLQMWADSGLVASVLFGALWLAAVWDGYRLVRLRRDAAAFGLCASMVSWTVHSLVDFDLYVPGVAIPAFGLLGAVQGLKDPAEAASTVPQGRLRWAVAAIVTAIIGLTFVVQGRSLVAQVAHSKARLLRQTDPEAGLEAALRSVRLQPKNGYYWATTGDLAAQLRAFEQAVRCYQQAIANDPYRASYHWRLARVLAASGAHPARVIEKLRDAVALNPSKERYRRDLEAALEGYRELPGTATTQP